MHAGSIYVKILTPLPPLARHDAVCNGYPVCCVAIGTCPATVSSNALYYDGIDVYVYAGVH